MDRKTKIANLKMKHAFRYLNGSAYGHAKHAPQRPQEWNYRERMANRKKAELQRQGYHWQVERINNYNHRLRKEWK